MRHLLAASLSFCLSLWSSGSAAEHVQERHKSLPSASRSDLKAQPNINSGKSAATVNSAGQASGELELEAAIEVLFRGRRTQAHADLYKALDLVKRSGNTALVARAHYFIGVVEGDLGRDAPARFAFDSARSLSRQSGWLSLESFAVRGLADLEEEQGNLVQARELYQEAIKLAQQDDDPKGLANAQYGLAELEQRQGNSEAALQAMRSSLASATKSNYDQGVVNALTALGRFQLQAGTLDGAIKSYDAADKLHIQLRDRLGHARVKLGLGDIKRLQQKPKEARQFYEDANLLYLAEQFVVGQGNAQRRLAGLYAEHPDLSEGGNPGNSRSGPARQALSKAIDLYKTADASPGLANAYFELADIDMAEQAYGNAAKNYGLAFEHYKARQDTTGQANVMTKLDLIRMQAYNAAVTAENLQIQAAAQADSKPALAIELWTQAEQEYRKLLDVLPDRPITLTNWGLLLTHMAQLLTREKLPKAGDVWKRALEKYDLALQLNPSFISAIFQKGVTLQLYAEAVEPIDVKGADALRQRAVAQYAQVLAQPAEVFHTMLLTAITQPEKTTKQKLAEFMASQVRPNTEPEFRHSRYGAANNWSNILQQQAQAVVKNDLPAARELLRQSYGKSQLAIQIEPPGHNALSNWAVALMVEHKALLNIEPLEAAKVLLQARNLLLPAATQAPDVLAYNLACTYALEGNAKDTVFWLKKARLGGDAVRQSDVLDDQDFNSIRQEPEFLAWFKSLKSIQK